MEGLKQNFRARSRLEVFYTGGTVRLSNDGATLACACADEVKLVQVDTGAVVKTLAGDSEPVTSLALSRDGSLVFVASRSLQLRAFSSETGQPIRTFKGHRAPIADMSVDSSGALLATASADRSCRVWDIDGGYCTHVFTGHSGILLTCIFHPTQLLLATGSDDSQVRVWDLVSKSCVATLQGHFSAVTSLSLSPDGWTLLSGSRDGVVIAWSLRDYSKVATVPVYEAVEGLVAVPASVCIAGAKAGAATPLCFATGGGKGVVKLWRADTAQCIWDQTPAGAGTPTAAGAITELRALPNGAGNLGGGGLLAATQDCRLLFLGADNIHKDKVGKLNLLRHLIGSNDEVTDLRFINASDDAPSTSNSNSAVVQPTHLAVSTNSEHIRLYDASTLSCTAILDGHSDIVISLDSVRLKTNGRSLLASGSKDASVRVWTVPEGRCVGLGKGHVSAVGAVAFSRRSGGFLVSGGADKLLKVWDTSVLELDGGEGQSPPAAMRVTAAVAAHDKDINAVAVAPNDSVVATASQDRTAKIWKLPDLVLATTLKGHKRGVWAVAFSPVDQAVATASGDKTVRMWALRDGSCLRTFEGHLASVLRVDFLSAGTQIMSAGGDGLLKLWNVRTSECVNTFDAHEDKVWALALGGSDGGLAASGGGDGSVVIWEDCTEADADLAARDAEAVLLHDQDLSNAVHDKDWERAAKLALELGRPGQLLKVVDEALLTSADAQESERILSRVARGLLGDSLRQCLEYCRDWNTNARTCVAAQAMLAAVLRVHPPAELLAVPGVSAVLEALTAYTQRHFQRVDRLLRSTFVVDYVLGAMNVLTPEDGDDIHAEGTHGVPLTRLANGKNHPQEPLANGHHNAQHTSSLMATSGSPSDDDTSGSDADHDEVVAPRRTGRSREVDALTLSAKPGRETRQAKKQQDKASVDKGNKRRKKK